MKTKFKFWALPAIALSAATLVSCSQDEVVESLKSQESPIRFHSDIMSRGEVTTAENLKEIWVHAVSQAAAGGDSEVIITGDTFTKDDASQMYISANDYYWPSSGAVEFFAMNPSPEAMMGKDVLNEFPEGYAGEPFDATITTVPEESFFVINDKQKVLYNYYSPTDIKAQKDIIIATATAAKETSEKSGVKLSFQHALSQIIVKAKCEREDGYTVTAANTGFGGHAHYATLSITKSGIEWSRRYHDGKMHSFSIIAGKKLGVDAQTLTEVPYMLIPDNLSAWDVKTDKTNESLLSYLVVNVKIMKDGKQVFPDESNWTTEEVNARISMTYGRVAIPLAINWEAGKKYIYTIDFSDGFGYYLPNDPTKPGEPILGNPIKIANVEVEDWDDTTPEKELIP